MSLTGCKKLFVEPFLLYRFKTGEFKRRRPCIVTSGRSSILACHKSQKFDFYTGLKYRRQVVMRGMVGFRFGEYFSTRSRYVYRSKKGQKVRRVN